MLGGKNIEEGFGIAYRVIQVCCIWDDLCHVFWSSILGEKMQYSNNKNLTYWRYTVKQSQVNFIWNLFKSLHVCLLFLLLFLPQDFQLEAQAVYVRAGQRLVRQRQYGAVRQLLKCVGESGTATKNDCDALILSCVSIADKGPADVSDEWR